jgi:hypothetical protein
MLARSDLDHSAYAPYNATNLCLGGVNDLYSQDLN